jgi:hypothetical protein
MIWWIISHILIGRPRTGVAVCISSLSFRRRLKLSLSSSHHDKMSRVDVCKSLSLFFNKSKKNESYKDSLKHNGDYLANAMESG